MREKYVFFKYNLGITSFILFLAGFVLFIIGELLFGFDQGGFEIIGTIIIVFVGSILFLIILSLFLTSVRTVIPYILLILPYLVSCIIRSVIDVRPAIVLLIGGVLLITFLVIFILFSRKTIDTELADQETIVQPVKITPSSVESKTISTDMLIQIISLILMAVILLVVWFMIPISPLELAAVFLYLGGHLLSLHYLSENYNWNFNLISSILSVILFATLTLNLLHYASGLYYGIGLGCLIIGNSIILVFSFKRTVKAKITDTNEEKIAEKIPEE